MTAILALDIGGTKLAAGLVSRDGQVLVHDRAPTPVTDDPEVLWWALAEVVDTLLEHADAEPYAAIGIGCGGPMEWPQGRVSPINIPGWRGFPLLTRIRERYAGGRPCAIHNDAVALALAEHRWGAGHGHHHMLGIVVSTGVGGGLVIGGRRVDGGTGNAGHVGHIIVDPEGPPCPCGSRGCVEAIARGPALAAYAVERGWTGQETGVAVAAGARAGDPACLAAFERAGRAVGLGLVSVAATLDLDMVVVGGGIAQTGSLFLDPLHAAFEEYAGLAFVRRCAIVPARLGPTAGLAGAAALVVDEVV